MNVKQILLGVVMVGLLAGSAEATWDLDSKESMAKYRSDLSAYRDSLGAGIFGWVGVGSSPMAILFTSVGDGTGYKQAVLVPYPIPDSSGILPWQIVHNPNIPFVYELDGTTPAKMGTEFQTTSKTEIPPISEMDGEVPHDICTGTDAVMQNLAYPVVNNDGEITYQIWSDFCYDDRHRPTKIAQSLKGKGVNVVN